MHSRPPRPLGVRGAGPQVQLRGAGPQVHPGRLAVGRGSPGPARPGSVEPGGCPAMSSPGVGRAVALLGPSLWLCLPWPLAGGLRRGARPHVRLQGLSVSPGSVYTRTD